MVNNKKKANIEVESSDPADITHKDLAKCQIHQTAMAHSSIGKGIQRGFEEAIDREDIIIPRVKLLQALSPEVIDNHETYKPGVIINSLTGEFLKYEFVPIFKFTEWIRFNPRSKQDAGFDQKYAPGAIIWRSTDPANPRVIAESKFGDTGEKPLATKFLNFLCYFIGHDMPITLSFSRSTFTAGKKLLSIALFARGDMFSRKYTLCVKQEENDLGKFFTYYAVPDGLVSDAEHAIALSWYTIFKSKTIEVHFDDLAKQDAQTD